MILDAIAIMCWDKAKIKVYLLHHMHKDIRIDH